MKAKAEEKEIVKRALAMLHAPAWVERSQPLGDRDPEPEPTPKPDHPDPEALTAKILAEFQPDEADCIVTAWRKMLGIKLDRGRVHQHLDELRKWQRRWMQR